MTTGNIQSSSQTSLLAALAAQSSTTTASSQNGDSTDIILETLLQEETTVNSNTGASSQGSDSTDAASSAALSALISSPEFEQFLTDAEAVLQGTGNASAITADLAALGQSLTSLEQLLPAGSTAQQLVQQLNECVQANASQSGTETTQQQAMTLFAYMLVIILAQIQVSHDQSESSANTNDLMTSTSSMMQQIAQQTAQQVQQYLAELQAASHESALEQIFSAVGMGVLFLVGCLTEQPELCAMAVLMIVMQYSGANDDLNNAIKGMPLGEQIAIQAAIAVGETILTGGLAGGGEGEAEAGAADATEITATTAVDTTVEASADFSESEAVNNQAMLDTTTSSDWVEVGDDSSAAKESGSASSKSYASVADLKAAEQAESESASNLDQVTKVLKKNLKDAEKALNKLTEDSSQSSSNTATDAGTVAGKAGKSSKEVKLAKNLLSSFLTNLSTTQFWQDSFSGLASQFTSDQETQNLVGAVGGTVAGLGTMAAGQAFLKESKGTFAVTQWLKGNISEGKMQALKKAILIAYGAMQITDGAISIKKGFIEQDQAATLQQQGQDSMDMSITQSVLQQIETDASQMQETYTSLNQNFASMNKNAQHLLDAYRA